MVEYSTGYKDRMREKLETLDRSFSAKARTVAQGLTAHFEKSVTKSEQGEREAA